MRKRLVYGVGINDASYVVEVKETIEWVNGKQKQKLVWACPSYQVWKDMLKRCYSEKFKTKYSTYRDCSVCPEWYLFSNFKSWAEQQDWEGKQLDKDLLFPGNKVYSPENCVFVSRQVNMFLVDSGATRGEYKIGVSWLKDRKKFQSRCSNPFTGEQEYLGHFSTEQESHETWLARKLEHAHALAAIQTDLRIAKALIDRYENYKGEDE